MRLNHASFQKLKRVGLHSLFWFASLGFFWLLFSRNSNDLLNTAIFIAILSPVAIFITYFFNYHLIPAFLVKGDYFKFAWFGTVTAVLGLWITMFGGIFIWMWRAKFELGDVNKEMMDIPMLIAALFFVVLMGISAKLIRINYQVRLQKDAADKQRLMLDNQLKINELKLLKEQLNPHFLFNTLNNIYGLTLEKSDKAPDLVMRLSNMLDYMLYRTNVTNVPLVQEVEMIRDYVTIEQHRFEGKYPISFEVKGELMAQEIAPLLLLPLVENCFKHGVRKSLRHSYVKISIEVKDDYIIFQTLNSTDAEVKANIGGIGLENLKKRLKMLYPDTHVLELVESEEEFAALLTIKLTN